MFFLPPPFRAFFLFFWINFFALRKCYEIVLIWLNKSSRLRLPGTNEKFWLLLLLLYEQFNFTPWRSAISRLKNPAAVKHIFLWRSCIENNFNWKRKKDWSIDRSVDLSWFPMVIIILICGIEMRPVRESSYD